jgi:hypothetical protein
MFARYIMNFAEIENIFDIFGKDSNKRYRSPTWIGFLGSLVPMNNGWNILPKRVRQV